MWCGRNNEDNNQYVKKKEKPMKKAIIINNESLVYYENMESNIDNNVMADSEENGWYIEPMEQYSGRRKRMHYTLPLIGSRSLVLTEEKKIVGKKLTVLVREEAFSNPLTNGEGQLWRQKEDTDDKYWNDDGRRRKPM